MVHYGTTQAAIRYPLILPLPVNAVYHFDASNTDSLLRNSSNQVTRWVNLLGNSNDDLLPHWFSSVGPGVVTNSVFQNGLPTVSFNAALLATNQSISSYVNPYNCLISGVARTHWEGNQRCWMSTGNSLGLTHNTFGMWGMVVEDVEWWLPASAQADVFHLQTLTVFGGNAQLRYNGSVMGSRGITPISPQPGIWLGGDQYDKIYCDICEVVVVSGTGWGVAERDQVESYLRQKWNV
jgi:hypothetical protein